MSPKRSVVATRLSDLPGCFRRAVMHRPISPRRTNALVVAVGLIASISFQPLTPAQAATLWTRSQHALIAQTSKSSSKPVADPAYEPPPKHGTNYVAPTASTASSNGSSGPEKLNLRTRTSRTFSNGGRQLTTLVYPDSVNYRDASGAWQAIDDSLVKTALAHYAYQNKANRYSVFLPADIGSEPIRMAVGSTWLTFSLQGAKGAATVVGSTATYSNALPGVAVVVGAQPDTLEESLVLQGPASTSHFTYRLQMSSGLKLRSAGNEVTVIDASGEAVFEMTAPDMYDSAKGGRAHSSAIAVSASSVGQGTNVTLDADATWLGNGKRAWPVTIDPTFIVGDVRDCYINASTPDHQLLRR